MRPSLGGLSSDSYNSKGFRLGEVKCSKASGVDGFSFCHAPYTRPAKSLLNWRTNNSPPRHSAAVHAASQDRDLARSIVPAVSMISFATRMTNTAHTGKPVA